MDWPKLCITRLPDQIFGMSISPQDTLIPFFNSQGTNYYRPWKLCEELAKKDFGSTVDNAKDLFKVTLDVQHFLPNEVSVKVNEKEVIIEGKHEERKDDHGFVSRQFVRRYALPKDCLSESVTSTLSSDGVLTITAKKQTLTKIDSEKIIPIKMSGPSRNAEKIEEAKNDKSEIKSVTGEINNNKCELKNEEYGMKSKNTCEMKSNKICETKDDKCDIKKDVEKGKIEFQALPKEEHSRLLKPELLGETACGTEKILSQSWKETDELLKLISSDKTLTSGTSEKLEEALGQCKTAINELKKDKLSETNMTAISEMCSMKSSMMSETVAMSQSSSVKASTSEKMSDVVSEIICAELEEAAENI